MAGLRLDGESLNTGAEIGAASASNKADSQNALPKHHETVGKRAGLDASISKEASSEAASEETNTPKPSAADSIGKQQPAPLSPVRRPISNTTATTKPHTSNMGKPTPDELSSDEDQILQKGICEGDTDIIGNVLADDLVKNAFENLSHEVQWQCMLHQGGEVPRLVAVQGEVADDGSMPVYRHPSDESPPLLPFSPTVSAIKAATGKHLGHPLNHVLIQFYRDGRDYISEHRDKTIDVVKGSYIANVS